MLQPDLQRLEHIRYGSMSRDVICETAVTDIPVLRDFCNEYLVVND